MMGQKFNQRYSKKQILKLLSLNQEPIRIGTHYSKFMLTLNQFKFLYYLQCNQQIDLYDWSSFPLKEINQFVEDQDIVNSLNFINYLKPDQDQKYICFNLNDDSIIDVLYEDFEYIEYKVDDEFVSKLRKQNEMHQLLIKLSIYLNYYQNEINNLIKNIMVSIIPQQPSLKPIKDRAYLENLNIITIQNQNIEIEVTPTHKAFLYNEQIENHLISKAFELLDNNMYSFGRRKRSFEKEKETAYSTSRGAFEALYPMDLHLAIFSQVAPPTTSPALTQVSNLSQYGQSLCLSPSNSDSQSFASFGPRKMNVFEPQPQKQMNPFAGIDQNQYAQISQQNIDAQIRYRKLYISQCQNQRVSRSKSNSALPNIFKQIELKDEKVEEKRKQVNKQGKQKQRKVSKLNK